MAITISTRSLEAHTLECLRNMFGASPTWRALVAQPNVAWETLDAAILVEIETASDPAAALTRVRYGVLQDKPDHPDYVPPPRICLRHPVSGDIRRMSTTGFESTSTVICVVQFPTPDDYQASLEEAMVDFLNKVGGIEYDLQSVRGPGYADVGQIALSVAGDLDKKRNNGKLWFGGEIFIQCRGGR